MKWQGVRERSGYIEVEPGGEEHGTRVEDGHGRVEDGKIWVFVGCVIHYVVTNMYFGISVLT